MTAMEISKCALKQKQDVHLTNGESIVTVEFNHSSFEDLNNHMFVSEKNLAVLPPKFGQFTLTLIPKDDEVSL